MKNKIDKPGSLKPGSHVWMWSDDLNGLCWVNGVDDAHATTQNVWRKKRGLSGRYVLIELKPVKQKS